MQATANAPVRATSTRTCHPRCTEGSLRRRSSVPPPSSTNMGVGVFRSDLTQPGSSYVVPAPRCGHTSPDRQAAFQGSSAASSTIRPRNLAPPLSRTRPPYVPIYMDGAPLVRGVDRPFPRAESEGHPYVMVPHDRGGASSSHDPPKVGASSPDGQHGLVRINDAEVEISSVPSQEWEPAQQALAETLSSWDGGPPGSGLVQRFIGLGPVLLLSLAVVVSAVIGLNLSDASSSQVADRLGCRHISSGTSETGVSQEMCAFHGVRIVIWSFGPGPNVVYPLSWTESAVQGPTWIVGCGNADDCVTIRGRLGGKLLGPAWMGSSVEVQ